MRIARGAEEARATVLKRTPVETAELPAAVREVIRRTFGGDLSVGEVVARILRDVREQGDAAVVRFNEEIDGVHGDLARSLEVSEEEIESAYGHLDKALVTALRAAADQIRSFHKGQIGRAHV